MKTVRILVILIFAELVSQAALATEKKNKFSTQVDFDDRIVSGKYQFSTEAITKVENDKSLDDLIGVRKNFKDKDSQYKDLR
jgi:hypothetical protein